MTRTHDGSPPPEFQSETSAPRAGAPRQTMKAARVLVNDEDEPPIRNVLVSYDEFRPTSIRVMEPAEMKRLLQRVLS